MDNLWNLVSFMEEVTLCEIYRTSQALGQSTTEILPRNRNLCIPRGYILNAAYAIEK
jgi:hypothetical protein